MNLVERIVAAFAAAIYYPLLYLGRSLGATGRWFWRHKLLLTIVILISPIVILGIALGLELTFVSSLMTGLLALQFATVAAAGAVVELNKPGGGIGAFAAFVALALGGYGVWKVATILGWW